MAHIPEDELAVYAYYPESLPVSRRSEIEREIGTCTYCRTTSDFLSAQESELTDSDVWEPLTGSATLDSLRTLGARLAAEDEEAEEFLASYLSAPARTAWKTLAAKRRYRTGGVVRKLTGERTEVTRAEWAIALLFVRSGKVYDGIRRLRAVIVAFARAGMVTDAGLTGLDLADALLAVSEIRQIVALSTHLFEVFTSHDMFTGALAAIAFLERAAKSGTLTKTDIATIRDFFRRAERQPQLLFVPPHTT
jgi:hypothetical protein